MVRSLRTGPVECEGQPAPGPPLGSAIRPESVLAPRTCEFSVGEKRRLEPEAGLYPSAHARYRQVVVSSGSRSLSPPHEPSFAIRLEGLLTPLRLGETLIGRGSASDIVVPSEKASRTHAKLTVDLSGVTIEDLKSTNGVFVNDKMIDGPVRLALHDEIRIGDSRLELVGFEDLKRTRREDPVSLSALKTEPGSVPGPGGATERVETFEVVGPLIEKMLTLGRLDEAERLLAMPMQRMLRHLQEGSRVDPQVMAQAAVFAVRVAEVTGTARPIDTCIQIHSVAARPLPISVIDELYRVLRGIRGIDRAVLATYVARLEARAATLAPTERFALKRIAGLQRLTGA